MEYNIKSILFACICFVSLTSCEKFTNVDTPPGVIVADKVFTDSTKAISAMMGIYANMINGSNSFSNWLTTVYAGYSSDELTRFNASVIDLQFIENQLTPDNAWVGNIWRSIYPNIYYANQVIEGLEHSNLSESIKSELIGEAKFIRAFCYFYLVNLYGPVPLVLSADYIENESIGRTGSDIVYQQIVDDLLASIQLLPDRYSSERERPTVWAAKALLARTFLYLEDWEAAVSYSTDVINAPFFSPLPSLDQVFAKNSAEVIWQLAQTRTTVPEYFFAFRKSSLPSNHLTSHFMAAFETKDGRRESWLDSITYQESNFYLPSKYKSDLNSQFYVVLRTAEQYLIRAEALAMQGKIHESVEDLNLIRTRAGLDAITTIHDEGAVMEAIVNERRIEFMVEWGHRWFDLKRLNIVDEILGNIKPNWSSSRALFPIPQSEITANANLIQNIGY